MSLHNKKNNNPLGTEEKIKNAAKKLFTQNGFDATRTRDIAEEAGINLALLNYYFRSKQRLFEVIMHENIALFVQEIIIKIEQQPNLSLLQKTEIVIENYIDLLLKNPDLPLFILNISKDFKIDNKKQDNTLLASVNKMRNYFISSIQKELKEGKIKNIHPLHIIANIMGLIVFPFAASALLQTRTGISKKEFEQLMIERKKLIPIWIHNMFYN